MSAICNAGLMSGREFSCRLFELLLDFNYAGEPAR